MKIPLKVALELFEEANAWDTERVKYLDRDSKIRALAIDVFHKDSLSTQRHVCAEIFRVIAEAAFRFRPGSFEGEKRRKEIVVATMRAWPKAANARELLLVLDALSIELLSYPESEPDTNAPARDVPLGGENDPSVKGK